MSISNAGSMLNHLDIPTWQHKKLDDILLINDDREKTLALASWQSAGESLDDPYVLIKTNDGKALHTKFLQSDGTHMVVGPRGRKVSRRVATELLMLYGIHGQYRGKDQATGLNRQQYNRLNAEDPIQTQALKEEQGDPKFITNYLTHVVTSTEDDETPAPVADE